MTRTTVDEGGTIGRGYARTVVLPEAVWAVGPPQPAGEYDRLGIHERALRASMKQTRRRVFVWFG